MANPQATVTTGFFRLPPELRNRVYEDVLAEVKDNVCIRIQGGPNAPYTERILKAKRCLTSRVVPTDEEDELNAPHKEKRLQAKRSRVVSVDEEDELSQTGRLSMLLVCRQINAEATGIAYSKMSLSLDQPLARKPFPSRAWPKKARKAQKLKVKLDKLLEVFGVQKLGFVGHLRLSNDRMLANIVMLEHYLDLNLWNGNSQICTAECYKRSIFGFPLHKYFHRIIHITVTATPYEPEWDDLKAGASWLSICTTASGIKSLLYTMPILSEVVCFRIGSGEQVSIIEGEQMLVAESRRPLLGLDGWKD